jgi:hypothetical protein
MQLDQPRKLSGLIFSRKDFVVRRLQIAGGFRSGFSANQIRAARGFANGGWIHFGFTQGCARR